MTISLRALPAALLLLLAACGAPDQPAEAAASPAPPAGTVVDTVRSMDEEFRRFTEGMGPAPERLSGGAGSVDALARRFLAAVEARDTADLRKMLLTREEFAHLYWRGSAISKPPYEMPPGLLWFQLEGGSATGVRRLIGELGGKDLAYEGVECSGVRPDAGNGNRVHAGCEVALSVDGRRGTGELFGNVLERGGHFKFISYANDF